MKKFMMLIIGLFLFGICVVHAQDKTITGTVTSSEDGLGLPGVTVSVKGTTIGSITDIDGKYVLLVPEGSKMLVFSFVGMKTIENSILGISSLDMVMNPDLVGIEEVVVTALGISKEKKAIGFAATSVGGDEISDAKVVNPMSALQGRVSGIDIALAPGPGSTQNVIIRGASSFGSNQPLYVVDGVPLVNEQNRQGNGVTGNADFGSGINAVNPYDIENMTVLKGAAATALYGSRAANGVILITTKSGENTKGKMNVTYDGSYTISRVGRIPERQSTFGQGVAGTQDLTENINWGPKYTGQNRPVGFVIDNSQLIKPYAFVDSRVRDFYELGKGIKNAVSLSGGNDISTYYFSFSNNSDDGSLPGAVDTYDRNTFSTKGSHTWNRVKIETSVKYSNEKTKTVPSGQGYTVYQSLWEIPEDYSVVDMKDYNSKYWNQDNYFTYYMANPYFLLNENGAKQVKNKVFGKVQLDVDLAKGLKAVYRFGGDIESSNYESWEAKIELDQNAPGYDPDKRNEVAGNYFNSIYKRYEINHEAYLTYEKKINDFNINALLGLNVNERGADVLSGSNTALDVSNFYHLSNTVTGSEATQSAEGMGSPYMRRLYGIYTNIDMYYKHMFYMTVSARNDKSSTLPQSNNSYFYPGLTGSVMVSEVMKQSGVEVNAIDYIKVRAAYGWTGKDADPYNVYSYYTRGYSNNPGYPGVEPLLFPLNGVNSWTYSDLLANPDLKPEITKEFELGGDIYLFKNRLGVEFSYYNKLTNGLISQRPLDPSTGFSSKISNIGDVRNKGIELLVFVTPVRSSDFEWNFSVNYSRNRNKVESLEDTEVPLVDIPGLSLVAVEGEEIGVFKTRTVATTPDGKIIVDGNGIPKASSEDMVLSDKSVNEKYRLGFTNTLMYKGVTLSATLDYRHGGYMYSAQKEKMSWSGSGPETVYNDRNPFIVPNSVMETADGQYVENTTAITNNVLDAFYYSGGFKKLDNFLIDRSYLKLRSLSLSYNLPKSLVSKIKLGSVRVTIVAGNILLWTPKENPYIDPETTSFGNDISAKYGEYGAYPTEQTYTFGLSATF